LSVRATLSIVPPVPEAALAPVGPVRREAALARLCGLGLSTPATSFTQDELLPLLGLAEDPFAETIFASSGVRKRHLELSPRTLATSLQERTEATEEQLLRLALDATKQLAFEPEEIGLVVSATYYSLGGPTLAHRLVDELGLEPGTDKYHLVGVGCASAVPLFRLAAQGLRDHPGRKALVVAAESVSGFLTGVEPGDGKAKVVGSALFGDGCAAALLGGAGEDGGDREDDRAPGEPGGPMILATAVHQVAGTLGHVRFGVTGDDSHMRIARELPAVTEEGAPPLVERFLREHGLAQADVDHWLVHPGGPGIIEAVQRGLGLADEQVAPSFRVLSEFGNVGTPASFFVLAETIEERRPAPGDIGLMITIGPGVTVGLMLLAWR
jgi:predicted naringenin-chalcone synthase